MPCTVPVGTLDELLFIRARDPKKSAVMRIAKIRQKTVLPRADTGCT